MREKAQAVSSSSEDRDSSDSEAAGSSDDHQSSSDSEPQDELTFEQLERLRQDGSFSGRAFQPHPTSKPAHLPMHAKQKRNKAPAADIAVTNTKGSSGGKPGGTPVKEVKAKSETAAEAAARRFRRENKNRPRELSSKRPVKRFREVVEVPRRAGADPRFEALAGKLDEERFRKQYAFLYDEQLPAERQRLKTELQRAKAAEQVEGLQAELTRVTQQIRDEKARRRRTQVEAEQKAVEKERVKGGKKPFYPKKSEMRRAELVRKYQELKASGGLEKALAKRRKRNAAKDHRYVPAGRRDT